MTGAAFHNGTSKQDYATPRDFFEAVCKRFGTPKFDLAASPENTKCPRFFDEGTDSLSHNWEELDETRLWLNPPYSSIEPWAMKCALTRKKGILFLVPASVGSNWFAQYVFPYADVFFLRPRLSFDGKSPYPKDLILAHYYGAAYPSTIQFECWKWR